MPKPPTNRVYLDEVHGLLREITACLKTLSLYPENHPAISPALERTLKKLRALFQDRDSFEFGVTKEEVLIFSEETEEERIPTDLAPRLHQRGILTVKFGSGLTQEEFAVFLRCLSDQRNASECETSVDRLLQQAGITNISITLLDYRKIVDHEPVVAPGKAGEDFWSALIHKVRQGDKIALQEMAASIHDPAQIHSVNAQIVKTLTASPSGDTPFNPGKVLAEIHHKVFQSLSEEERQAFSGNVARTLFSDGISPLDESSRQLSQAVSEYSDEMLFQVLASAIVLRGRIDNRVTGTFQNLFQDKKRRESFLHLADTYSQTTHSSAYPSAVWGHIRSLFLSGSEDSFMSSQYHQVLHDLNQFHLEELKETIDSEYIRQAQASLGTEVFQQIRKDMVLELILRQNQEPLLDSHLVELRAILTEYSRNRDMKSIKKVLERLLSADQEPFSTTQRPRIETTVFNGKDSWLSPLIRGIGTMNDEDLTLLDEILALGKERFAGVLIQQLGEERSISGRKRLSTLLIGLGPKGVPAILESLGDDRWFLVRNLVMILGKTADESCIEKLTSLLEHDHFRVRKEVLFTLSLIGGDKVVPQIRRILLNRSGKTDPGLQTVAALALKRIRTQKSRKVLKEGLIDRDKKVQEVCCEVLKGLL